MIRPATLLKAFADPVRLRLLNLLREGETCVGDLVTVLGVAQPRASRHLGHLRRAGLVRVRNLGRWAYYSLAPARTRVHRRLLDCLRASPQEDPRLARDLVRVKALRAAGGCCPPERRIRR